jgi:hypothetical protein
VSYHEKNPVSSDLHLTILDGMIGRVLAKREFMRSGKLAVSGSASRSTQPREQVFAPASTLVDERTIDGFLPFG